MFRSSLAIWPCVLAGGLLCLSERPAAAQSLDPDGVVRISDSVPESPKPIPESGPDGIANSSSAPCPPGYASPYGGTYGDYRNGYGSGQLCGGFSPPVKRPIYRSPVIYQKNFPNSWTGEPVPPAPAYRLPSVYMPTDTTQMGYYYQVVPYWLPRYNAIPPAPIPNEWHLLLSQTQHYGHPAGVVLGTAPVATPAPAPGILPTPIGSREGIIPPPPTPAQTMQATMTAPVLKPASTPNLLPVE